MALTPRLDSIGALIRKVERERVRAFHHPHATHKADHLYNFCITAHAIRDYVKERLGTTDPLTKQPIENSWSNDPLLVAVREIANMAKHFRLRASPRTRKVRSARTSIVDFYMDDAGNLIRKRRSNVPSYVIILESGQSYEMDKFMYEVLGYWEAFLKARGIRLRRQPWRTLHPRTT